MDTSKIDTSKFKIIDNKPIANFVWSKYFLCIFFCIYFFIFEIYFLLSIGKWNSSLVIILILIILILIFFIKRSKKYYVYYDDRGVWYTKSNGSQGMYWDNLDWIGFSNSFLALAFNSYTLTLRNKYKNEEIIIRKVKYGKEYSIILNQELEKFKKNEKVIHVKIE